MALVAAASKGLGYASALGLASEEAKVAIFSRSQEAIQQAAAKITAETGAEVLPLVADVTQQEDLARVVEATITRFGALHILVPNSGGPPPGTFEQLDEAKWQQALDSTLFSTTRLIQHALPHLKAAGWGRIVVITSKYCQAADCGLIAVQYGARGHRRPVENAVTGIRSVWHYR